MQYPLIHSTINLILHALKQTSTTDASEHEGLLPTKKKKKKKKQSLYSLSYEETQGYWTKEEHSQFKKGIILYGWGNWKKVESCIRNKVQIKSHTQKFSKRRLSQKDRRVSMYKENA